MAKNKEDLSEQIRDIFEGKEDYNPTDEELLTALTIPPKKGEDTDSQMQVQFVAKLYTRMNESVEFRKQVAELIRERMKKKSK